MSLSDHLEPMPPPPNGLGDVRRRARRGAIRRQLVSSVTAMTAMFLLVFGITASLNVIVGDSNENFASQSESTTPTNTASPSGGITLMPDQNRLPSSSVATRGNVGWGLVLIGGLIMATALARRLWVTWRSEVPLVRRNFVAIAVFVTGALIAAIGTLPLLF